MIWLSGRTRTWVIALFIWLAGTLFAQLAWGAHLIVELAIVVGLVAAYTTAGSLILSKLPLIPDDERRAWTLLATGMLMVAGGLVIQVVAALISPRVGAFGPLDLVFLAAYAVGLTGFALLPHLKTDLSSRRRLLLDGLVGAISIAALMWIFVGESVFNRLAQSVSWDFLIGSTYPVLDFAGFVVVMLVVLRRSNLRFDPRLMAVGLTFLLQGFGDILYFRAGIGMGFLEADPLYSLHLVAAAAIVVCGLLVERQPEPREFPDRDLPWPSLLAPYGAALLLVAVTAGHLLTSATLDSHLRFLLVSTSLVVVLVVLRQFLAIRENRSLLERERDALIASISHELRTPLTAVVGYLELLNDPSALGSDDECRELLATTKDQAVLLSSMVEDLVLVAREAPTALRVQRHEVEVRPIIDEAVGRVDGFPDRVEIHCSPGLTAMIDPDRVQQALVNLMHNARRYGARRCRVVAAGTGRRLVLEVHDDGPGVPERHRETIWKRFERGAHRLDAARPGSGIGLAMVDIIARAHDGAATYRPSELLGGACFELALIEPTQGILGDGTRERSAAQAAS